jgi:hypothetical protein
MPSLLYLQRVAKRHPDALSNSETQDGGHVRSGYTPEMMRALADTGGLTLESIDAISPRIDFEFANRFFRYQRPVAGDRPVQPVGVSGLRAGRRAGRSGMVLFDRRGHAQAGIDRVF